ncbi:MAG: hypothetical protein Q4A31_10335 [Corynebacterium sp.]|uniref:hypothetical protein n=1 Tax=Corynebacterium sp. TaxID=1720 RepID=UPI0026DB69B3|nr:hypothetical protein [Corynebacterium sp.]MDO4762306.1 hypothetical protein [Corynebacterium sp.]
MLAKIIALIASVLSALAALLIPIIGSDLAEKSGLAGSVARLDTSHEDKPLDVPLPADATVATALQLKEARVGKWVSTQRPNLTYIDFGEYSQGINGDPIAEEFAGSIPEDFQLIGGITGCNAGYGYVWFEGATLRLSKNNFSTLKQCGIDDHARRVELVGYLKAKPEVRFDSQGIMYLVRPDGKAAAFRRA